MNVDLLAVIPEMRAFFKQGDTVTETSSSIFFKASSVRDHFYVVVGHIILSFRISSGRFCSACFHTRSISYENHS